MYEGVRIDYSGPDVNAATFLAVLEGNSSAVPQGGGSGRVLASGPYDRIFLFYSDHGSPGVLGMPSGGCCRGDGGGGGAGVVVVVVGTRVGRWGIGWLDRA